MPTILPNLLAFDRDTLLFVVPETTFGVETKPGVTNQVLLATEGTIKQSRGFIPDPQRRNTLSMLNRFAGRFEDGQGNLTFLVKPSGTLGTVPEGAPLLKSLFGREIITPATKIEYFLLRTTDTRPSLTIWFKIGHFVYRALGTLCNKGRFPLKADNSTDALCQCALDILFAELRWTGTDEMAVAAIAAATALTVKNAKKFTLGGYIKIAANDNAGAGYNITAINYATNVLTITPGLTAAVAIDDVVAPWLPVGTEAGTPVHGRLGSATRGGITLPLLSGEISLDNKLDMLNEEKNGLDYPNRFAQPEARSVQANAEMYFDANSALHFYDAQQQVRGDLVFPWGTTAASRVKITAKNQEIDMPDISGTKKVLKLTGQAFASAAFDDELVMLFD